MGWQQFTDSLEQCLASKAALERQIILEAIQVSFDPIDKGQECFGLRSKIKGILLDHVIKRLDPEPVTRAEQRLIGFIPYGKGKHPTQMIYTIHPPFAIGCQNDFCV